MQAAFVERQALTFETLDQPFGDVDSAAIAEIQGVRPHDVGLLIAPLIEGDAQVVKFILKRRKGGQGVTLRGQGLDKSRGLLSAEGWVKVANPPIQ
ncbi:hypothetical protein [Pseudomonas sp. FW300-N1B4]|uniref:hypothetical protein n=1 Tax=Pseudomonas sp. FW300-N1B4 TaxID=2751315 RepID=UPI00385735DB